jgi:hypothetical protein
MNGLGRLAAQAFAVTLVLALLGAWPTLALGGPRALPAMVAGCAIGWLAGVLGAVPFFVLGSKSAPPSWRLYGILSSIVGRLVAVAALGAVAVRTGRFDTNPLLIWIAIGYGVNLAVDVRYTVKDLQRIGKR